MAQSGKIGVDKEDVVHTSVLVSIRYYGKRSITSTKNFATPTALTGCVPQCPIIDYLT